MSRIFTAKDGSDIPPVLVEMVQKKVDEYYEIANKFFSREFPRCKVEFGVSGTVAGYAHYQENKIRLNSEFILRQFDRMLERTVPHEIAHLLVFQIWGKDVLLRKVKPHGKEWKFIMAGVFGLDPSRCHDYEMRDVKQKNGQGYRRVPVNPHTKRRH